RVATCEGSAPRGAGQVCPAGLRRTGGLERRQRLDLPARSLARSSRPCVRLPDRKAGRPQALRPHRRLRGRLPLAPVPTLDAEPERSRRAWIGGAGLLPAVALGLGAAVLRPG